MVMAPVEQAGDVNYASPTGSVLTLDGLSVQVRNDGLQPSHNGAG
jgi:hypothetical protein